MMLGKSVLISGLGIAGPTLAYWLTECGFQPTLVERAPHLRTGGYVIDFWGIGFDVAERMGLLADLRRDGYEVHEVRFVNAQSQRVGGFGANVFRTLADGRYISLPRSTLAKMLYRKIEHRCETIFGERITEIAQDADGVRVAFERIPSRRVDIVIGADGQHSEVRRMAFGAEDLFEKYLGYMVAAFEVEGYQPRDELVYVSYAVPGKQVARFALRGGRTMFLFVFACDEPLPVGPHDTRAQKDILHATFREAGWECRPILAELDGSQDLYFDRVSQIRMDRWSTGSVALVGDAAFCPSLMAGQGAALAMTAAYVLAGELGRSNDQPSLAFRRYEELLRPLMAIKQRGAEQFTGEFAPRTRFGLFMRNQMTKTLAIPGVAKLLLGRTLLDRIELPAYSYRTAEDEPTSRL